ncbi:MAG TPA: lytic transglycosylase domain-containing protein [Frankiaceae bacterium]|nr:lytic transglycosylase domain-containing protein [Frankiaceae bacterium]
MGVRYRLVGALLPLALTAGFVSGCGGGGKTPAQEVLVPAAYKSYFQVASRRCPGVLTPPGMAAMAYVESRFDPEAESGNGAEGMMQILPSVFRQYGVDANGDGKRDIFNAADSVATSAVYTCVLARSVSSIKGDQVALRLAAYNAGIGAVHRYNGVPPYAETQDYIAQVKLWTARFAPQFASPTPSS